MTRAGKPHGNRSQNSPVIAFIHEFFNSAPEGQLLTREALVMEQRRRNCATDRMSLAQIISDYRIIYGKDYFIIAERNKGWRRVKRPEAARE